MTLSVCMIVKNEEQVLSRCLNCVQQFANEIIIVDTGSMDNTIEIAKRYTDSVNKFVWIDNFSAARNYSFSLATSDYVMWLDADDIIPPKSIEQLKTLDTDADCVYLPYKVGFDEQGECTLEYYRERIVKHSCGFQWQEPVHEHLAVSGNCVYFDIPIIHKPNHKEKTTRNLDIYRKQKHLSPRALYYYAREQKDHQLYCGAIQYYTEFLNTDGWFEDKISACIGLSECYLARKQTDDALSSLFQSLQYDLPRPETCCRIASIYFDSAKYAHSIYWYESALNAPHPTSGFINNDYFDFIPNIQLCVLYDRTGNKNKAIEHNNKAGSAKPNHPAYLHNLEWFKSKK